VRVCAFAGVYLGLPLGSDVYCEMHVLLSYTQKFKLMEEEEGFTFNSKFNFVTTLFQLGCVWQSCRVALVGADYSVKLKPF
jgi:hypothetical protein